MMLRERFLQMADSRSSLSDVLGTALTVRLTVWLWMACACHLLPNHNPGEDVPRLELSAEIESNTIPQSILFEDCRFSPAFYATDDNNHQTVSCSTTTQTVSSLVTYLQTVVYPFWLVPLTRWDAVRFLQLALKPQLRKKRNPHHETDSYQTTICSYDDCNDDMLLQQNVAEQAHAFLPLFPFAVRLVAVLLQTAVPRTLLPCRCAGILVLAAALLNGLCWLWAVADLYHMTKRMFLLQLSYGDEGSSAQLSSVVAQRWAGRVALLFVCNPANVFFTTSYSESLTAALQFRGCLGALHMVLLLSPSKDSNKWWWWLWLLYPGVFWWLAAWTRSNALLNAGFIQLLGMGVALRRENSTRLWKQVFILAWSTLLAVGMLAGSMGWHNYAGYRLLCSETPKPTWCSNGPTFNLYGYVQRQHWNVGLFRYYTWKQLPNFLLATPVLAWSCAAVVAWIKASWSQQCGQAAVGLSALWKWAVSSLQAFAGEPTPNYKPSTPDQVLVDSPLLLGFYAVLAASTLLCVTTAHVQISTRLLCSSCPALYWYGAALLQLKNDNLSNVLLGYCFLYVVLGGILHANWLPWT